MGASSRYPEVILVEGLFDYAVLWQAGFKTSPVRWEPISTLASFGNCATIPEPVYVTFDADGNDSGQQAAQCLTRSLREQGITARLVSLPERHDPNSFFVAGGSAPEFQHLLDRACL